MKNPNILADTGALASSKLPLPADPNTRAYLVPTTARFLAETAYGDYLLTVTERTRRHALAIASAAVGSWGETQAQVGSLTCSTDDLPSLLMLMTAARLSHHGTLALSYGDSTRQPVTISTPPQDTCTFDLKQRQRVLSRDELDVMTMRGRLAQAGGGR